MKVAELQSFVNSLAQPLRVCGGTNVAEELQQAVAGMNPFREMTIAQFADFLAKAEEYHRTGILPTPPSKGKRKKEKPVPLSVNEAAQAVLDLYEKASDPDLSNATIQALIARLDNDLKAPQMIALAKEVQLSLPKKPTKQLALGEIRRKIEERRENAGRIQFRPGSSVPDAVLTGNG
jgi:hypothetical protein